MKTALFLASGLFVFSLLSCTKEPGRGGTSSISGKVKVQDLNGLGEIQDEYWGMDEEVFIIYGDEDATYDDRVTTSYDGSYRFDYLTPGKYTLFAYSDCDTCSDGRMVVKTIVDITDKKTEYEAANLVIFK